MVHANSFPKANDGYFMIESIHDPIEVITMFGNGKMRPIRFRWKNKIVKVAKVTGDWIRHEGQNKIPFFGVFGGRFGYYGVCYNANDINLQVSRRLMGMGHAEVVGVEPRN